jgi:hypothetical protein
VGNADSGFVKREEFLLGISGSYILNFAACNQLSMKKY